MKMFRTLVKMIFPDKPMQTTQVILDDGTPKDDVEYYEPYGITSTCPDDDERESLTLTFDDDISQCINIMVGSRKLRMNVAKGEVALYDDMGQVVHLKRDMLLLKSPNKVEVDTPTLHCTGDIVAAGHVKDANGAKSMAGMRSTFNNHTNNGAGLSSGQM